MVTNNTVKKNRSQAVIQKMKERRYDPLDALIDIAQHPDTELETAVDIHKTLMKFAYPTLKHVDIEAQVKSDLIIQIKQFRNPNTPEIVDLEKESNNAFGSEFGQFRPVGESRTPIPIGRDHDAVVESLVNSAVDLKSAASLGGHRDVLPD